MRLSRKEAKALGNEITPEALKELDRASWSEETFQNKVVEIARGLGWKVAHFRRVCIRRANGSFYYATPVQADGEGFPDLVMLKGQRGLAWELKVKKNVTSPEQKDWLSRFGAVGFDCRVCRPQDWDELMNYLEEE